MSTPEKEKAARAAVQGLLRTDKMKALAVAVLVASSSMAGCTAQPRNQPCPGQPEGALCAQASGAESGWLTQPRWPAVETGPAGAEGQHLATRGDFVANPQYTQLRSGASSSASSSGGPSYYGGGHYYYYGSSGWGGSGSSGFSS